MEYLTLPGESCYTQADIEKLKKAIEAKNGRGPKVLDVQGCWVHYVHLGQCDSVKVGFPTFLEKERTLC